MGNGCFGKSTKDQALKKHLKKRAEEHSRITKLILLGTGESGKTTIRRQIQILYGKGFGEFERKNLKPQILYNVIDGITEIMRTISDRDISYDGDEEAKNIAASFIVLKAKISSDPSQFKLDQGLVDKILFLYNHHTFKMALSPEYRSNIQLSDGWEDFVNGLKRFPAWGGETWIPSLEDVLRARIRTIGMQRINFTIGESSYELADVGGQESERHKWVDFFKNGVNGVLFVASLSDYDQKMFENEKLSRLTDSVKVFETYANREEFKDSAIVLFLNKKDLLFRKFCIDKIPIEPDEGLFNVPPPTLDTNIGAKENVALVIDWFKDLYRSKLAENRRSSLFMYATCALQKENIEKATLAVHANLIKTSMMEIGVAF